MKAAKSTRRDTNVTREPPLVCPRERLVQGEVMFTPEIISSVASTVMSTTVALVALVFSYRQNVGWSPVALTTYEEIITPRASDGLEIELTVEVWNRRKYPIAVRDVRALISGVTLVNKLATARSGPYIQDNLFYEQAKHTIEPGKSVELKIRVECEEQPLNKFRPEFTISIGLLDPRRGTNSRLELKNRFMFPEFGWHEIARSDHASRSASRRWIARFAK